MSPSREKPVLDVDPPGYDCLAFLWMSEEGRKALDYIDGLVGKVKVKGDAMETYGNAAKLELAQKIRRLAKMACEKRMQS